MKFISFFLTIVLCLSCQVIGKRIKSREESLTFFAKFAYLADLVYHPDRIDSKIWNLEKKIFHEKTDGQVIVVSHVKEDLVSVSFRGTNTKDKEYKNIKTDLDRTKIDADSVCDGCKVHGGFWALYIDLLVETDQAFEEVMKKKPKAKVVITGHSLGGALATIYIGHIFKRWQQLYKDRIELITFGSPRVGNDKFAAAINLSIGKHNIYRVVYDNDPVSHVPLVSMGFIHVGDGRHYKMKDDRSFTKIDTPDKDVLNPWKFTTVGNHSKYKTIKGPARRSLIQKK